MPESEGQNDVATSFAKGGRTTSRAGLSSFAFIFISIVLRGHHFNLGVSGHHLSRHLPSVPWVPLRQAARQPHRVRLGLERVPRAAEARASKRVHVRGGTVSLRHQLYFISA